MADSKMHTNTALWNPRQYLYGSWIWWSLPDTISRRVAGKRLTDCSRLVGFCFTFAPLSTMRMAFGEIDRWRSSAGLGGVNKDRALEES